MPQKRRRAMPDMPMPRLIRKGQSQAKPQQSLRDIMEGGLSPAAKKRRDEMRAANKKRADRQRAINRAKAKERALKNATPQQQRRHGSRGA